MVPAILCLCLAVFCTATTAAIVFPFCYGCVPTMENFFTVNLGNVLTIVSFLGGGLAFVYTIRNDVQLQAQRMDFMQEANAQRLSSLEIEIRTLRDVLVDLAKQATRLDMLEQQLMELRREKH